MSGWLIARKRDAIHLYTDGAVWGDGAVLTDVQSKVTLLPGIAAAMTMRGNLIACNEVRRVMTATRWDSVSDAISALPDIVRGARDRLAPQLGHVEASKFDLAIAAFDTEPRAYFLSCSPTWTSAEGLEPGRLYGIGAPLSGMPMGVASDLAKYGFAVPDDPDDFSDADALVWFDACRATPRRPHGEAFYVVSVGGLLEATTITAAGATRRIIHTWAEDVIGRRIEADARKSCWIIDGNDVVRNALLFPVADTLETPITNEGGTDVVRLDLTANVLTHKVLLTTDVEMRAPIGIKAGLPHNVIVQQDSVGGWTVDWQTPPFIAPHPTISATPGAIHSIRQIAVDNNPLRIRATLDGDAFTEAPVLLHQDTITYQLSNSTPGAVPTIDLSSLDFLPGDLLICLGFAARDNVGGVFGSSWPLSNGSPGDWLPLDSAFSSSGSVSFRWGITGFYKFATGGESSITPFAFGAGTGGATDVRNRVAAHVFALRFLGGAVSLIGTPVAEVQVSADIATHTIAASGLAFPVAAFSYAGRFAGGSGSIPTDTPDQSFSETPDYNNRNRIATGDYELASRAKMRLFADPDTPADVTTDLPGSGVKGLLSFGIHVG